MELEANEILPLKSTELFLAYLLPPILRASNLPPDFVKHPHSRKTRPENSPRENQSRWFSPLISSTPPRPPRPRSTSSRLSSLPPDPSSWTSSAPAASPSPPSSPTPRPSSSARVAPPCCASPPVARPV